MTSWEITRTSAGFEKSGLAKWDWHWKVYSIADNTVLQTGLAHSQLKAMRWIKTLVVLYHMQATGNAN